MHFTSDLNLDGGVRERAFVLDSVPGVLWTPRHTSSPLILFGHNGGLHKREARLVARARHFVARYGFAVAAIDAPGHGDRPRSVVDDRVRADLRRALAAGEPVEDIFESFVHPLVEAAVPEWQMTLDALQALPEITGAVGYSGMTAIGVQLAVTEPRIAVLGLFAGGYVPRTVRAVAGRISVPLQFVVQWDDKDNDRQQALELFDAFGSREKTLHANLGGHAGTPWFEVDDGARFFARHLT